MDIRLYFFIDFFFDYNQITLYPNSKNIIIFIFSVDLLCYIILVQEATNLIIQFVQINIIILQNYILDKVKVFIDDVFIQKLYFRYNKKKDCSGYLQVCV